MRVRITDFVDEDRCVTVQKADKDQPDPVVERLLTLLAKDMQEHPNSSVIALPASLRERVEALEGHLEMNIEEESDGDVAL